MKTERQHRIEQVLDEVAQASDEELVAEVKAYHESLKTDGPEGLSLGGAAFNFAVSDSDTQRVNGGIGSSKINSNLT